jgi:O-6-methylguanine DNA methyltransferase
MIQKLSPEILKTTICHRISDVTVFARKKGKKVELIGLEFGQNKTFKGMKVKESGNPVLKKIKHKLTRYLDGGHESFSWVPIDVSWCTQFMLKVLSACRNIPRGSTVSYSQLAANAGHPNAVRAAASVMRKNRFPIIIPCHRVIATGGRIGGFMGSKVGTAIDLKKRLLILEKNKKNS